MLPQNCIYFMSEQNDALSTTYSNLVTLTAASAELVHNDLPTDFSLGGYLPEGQSVVCGHAHIGQLLMPRQSSCKLRT